jgi:hypothetical protein
VEDLKRGNGCRESLFALAAGQQPEQAIGFWLWDV